MPAICRNRAGAFLRDEPIYHGSNAPSLGVDYAFCRGLRFEHARAPGDRRRRRHRIDYRARADWMGSAGRRHGRAGRSRYAVYVDNVRNEMLGISCTPTPGALGFPCSGQLPSMSSGAHTLEIVAVSNVNGESVESPRSTPLHVVVSTALTAPVTAPSPQWQNGAAAPTSDGISLQVDRVAEGFNRPVDAAFAPDGRLFVVERNRVRVLTGARIQANPALATAPDDPSEQLLSIAFDPDFDRTRLVFVLQASDSRDGPVVYLSRYRELRGTLGQRAVLFQAPVDATPNASGLMRFGPDGKLQMSSAAALEPAKCSA